MRIGINTLALLDTLAGAERYTQNVIKVLSCVDKKNEYFIFLTPVNEKYYSVKADNFRNIVLDFSNKNRIRRIFYEQMILPAEVKKHGIDLLYSPNNISPLVFNAKSALMIFDLHWFRFEKLFSFSKMAYIKNMITLSAKRADVILTLSESSKKDICGLLNIKPEKIFITYSGAFDSTDDHENDNIIKQELPEKYILFIGQFHKRKNIPALIRAFNILKEKYDIKQDLVLVGRSGDDDCLINNEFKRSPFSGNIKIIGYVNDNEIKRIYKKSDVFVYPSLYEGFGIPVLEAMLTDVPVVTSGVSSLPEVGQDAVCYVDPYSDKDIADGIFRVLSDDDYRKKMIIKGREVSGRFTWVNTAKSTIKAFESVMGQ